MNPNYNVTWLRKRWDSVYHAENTPWDSGVVPPEVQTFWDSGLPLPAGPAIDLGCGTGTNVAFLARNTQSTIGFELSMTACIRTHERLSAMRRSGSVQCHVVQADVTSLPLQNAQAGYVLDIGCLHTIPPGRRVSYATGVIRNLAPGGWYHLYAHAGEAHRQSDETEGHGISPDEVFALFGSQLALLSVLRGTPDPRPCHWYLMRKPDF